MAWDSVNDALAARRNTRDFAQWDPVCKDAAVKDSLSGREECIGDEEFWSDVRSNTELVLRDLFSMTGKIEGYSIEFVWRT